MESPLVLMREPSRGRYVIAGEDIPAGGVVMNAPALAVATRRAPKHAKIRRGAVCCTRPGCFVLCGVSSRTKMIQPTTKPPRRIFRCGVCEEALYCSKECLRLDSRRHDLACSALKAVALQEEEEGQGRGDGGVDWDSVRLLISILVEVQSGEEQWRVQLASLVSHGEAAVGVRRAAAFVARWMGEEEDTCVDILQKIRFNAHPVYASNSVGGGGGGSVGLGIYPAACLVNHSCAPNAALGHQDGALTITLRATKDIKAGEEVSVSYLRDLFVPAAERASLLRAGYSFDCKCVRCDDAGVREEERAVACRDCGRRMDMDELVAENHPQEWRWRWFCQGCGTRATAEETESARRDASELLARAIQRLQEERHVDARRLLQRLLHRRGGLAWLPHFDPLVYTAALALTSTRTGDALADARARALGGGMAVAAVENGRRRKEDNDVARHPQVGVLQWSFARALLQLAIELKKDPSASAAALAMEREHGQRMREAASIFSVGLGPEHCWTLATTTESEKKL